MNKFRIIQSILLLVSVFTLVFSVPTFAANPGISTASAIFDIDLTVCKKTFDWEIFLTDLNNNIPNSNPYFPSVCGPENTLRLTDIKSNGFTNYNQAQIGTAQAKAFFANEPILSISPNQGRPAQNLGTGSPAAVDRSVATSLGNIFTTEQLNQIYSTGGARTGMPRVFFTGFQDANNDGVNDRDVYNPLKKFISKASGKQVNFSTCATKQANNTFIFDTAKCNKIDTTNVSECLINGTFSANLCEATYTGGVCEALNGQIRVREKRAGFPYNYTADRNPATPQTSCARTVNGVRLPAVEERNLQAYQFLYEFKYPTAAQCARIPPAGIDFNSCIEFYQSRYGKDLAGNADLNAGTKTLSAYTFYGSFDDKNSRWVGWRNPDVDIDTRNNSTDSLVRGYRGFSVYEF